MNLLPGFSEAYCFLDGVSGSAAIQSDMVENQKTILRKLCGMYGPLQFSNENDGTRLQYSAFDSQPGMFASQSELSVRTNTSILCQSLLLLLLSSSRTLQRTPCGAHCMISQRTDDDAT